MRKVADLFSLFSALCPVVKPSPKFLTWSSIFGAKNAQWISRDRFISPVRFVYVSFDQKTGRELKFSYLFQFFGSVYYTNNKTKFETKFETKRTGLMNLPQVKASIV